MPIYEFRCEPCNRVFSFLARTTEPDKQPRCPQCGRSGMRKLFSRFAAPSRSASRSAADGPHTPSDAGDGDLSPEQEVRLEKAMMGLARDIDKIDENNPREMASLMRRLSDATGEPIDEPTNEMIRRLEAGENPDRVEECLADEFPDDGQGAMCAGAPSYDSGLYDL